jgi:hypothetical protein
VNRRPRLGIAYRQAGDNPLKHRVFERLRSWADVELLDPTCEHPDIAARGFDLYHMAKRRHESLSDLERVARTTPTVNPPEGAWLTSDRVARHVALERAGVPVPPAEFGPVDAVDLEPPVVVKSRLEWAPDSHERVVVESGPLDFEGERFVEAFVEPTRVYKVYALGGTVRAVECTDGDSEVTPSAAIVDLVDSIRAATGLRLFEADVLEDGGWQVVDVNPVVSLRGIGDAADRYEAFLREVMAGGAAANGAHEPSRTT